MESPKASEPELPPVALNPALRKLARRWTRRVWVSSAPVGPELWRVLSAAAVASTHAFFLWMESAVILAAVAGTAAVLLALRLWIVLHSRGVVPRKSLSLMVVAGSGKYQGSDCRAGVGHYKPQSTPWRCSLVSLALLQHCMLRFVVSLRYRNRPAQPGKMLVGWRFPGQVFNNKWVTCPDLQLTSSAAYIFLTNY